MADVRVLVACEFSGVVRDAFLRRGHEAVSCDLLPTESPGPHHCGPVEEILDDGWDLMIAHPPCTYLANSGVRWFYGPDGEARWAALEEAARFYLFLYAAPIVRKCIENPVMHKHAARLIGHRATQFVQPWWFGHGEIKAIGLDLVNLPRLEPTDVVEGRHARVHRAPPHPDRWKERSRTLFGTAAAMAAQWG